MKLLLPIIVLAIFIMAVLVIWIRSRLPQSEDDAEEEAGEKAPGYRSRNYLMNKSEATFYRMLEQALGGKYMVLSKVRIEDFIDVIRKGRSRQESFGLRNRIKSRHVDFLVCDLISRPLMAIELDGGSHNQYHRQQRDDFVDGVYREAGLAIKHVRSGSSFADAIEEIGKELGGNAAG